MVDIHTVKTAASGQWADIVSRLGGVDAGLLDGKHHPCPKCGGKDRFRVFGDFASTGGAFCNQCFATDNGDGLSTLGWLTGESFPTTLGRVAEFLGCDQQIATGPGSMLEGVCRLKSISKASLIQFGAMEAVGVGGAVVRIPMFDADGSQCSHFDIATTSPKLQKGLNAAGKPAGLFWTERPTGGLVLLTEGVKDAAALNAMDYHAIGLPTCSLDPKFAPLFIGCDVVIVPDRDRAGSEGAALTAAALEGHVSSVKVATLPGQMRETGGDGVREVLAKYGEQVIRDAIANAAPADGLKPQPVSAPKFKTLTQASIDYIEQFARGDDLLSTGFNELDHALGGGVARGEMIVVAARPSHGKTAFAMQMLRNFALAGIAGLIVSQEMSASALGRRNVQYLSDDAEFNWQEQALRDLVAQQEKVSQPVYIVESCESASHVADVIGEGVSAHGVGAVAVDYLQLLKAEGRSRYEQVTAASVAVRKAATENNVPLIALCQLSRETDKRAGAVPQMSDIKESGQIEQDADVILALQWPLRMDPLHQPADEYRVRVFKNRNREIREPAVRFSFLPSRQMFREVDPMADHTWSP